MTEFVYRPTTTVPKKQWLEPLPFEAREVREGAPFGRWQRVYLGHDGHPLILKTKPTRNLKVPLPMTDLHHVGLGA